MIDTQILLKAENAAIKKYFAQKLCELCNFRRDSHSPHHKVKPKHLQTILKMSLFLNFYVNTRKIYLNFLNFSNK